MKVGILGTGNLSVALGMAWARAGHSLLITGRSEANAKSATASIGAGAEQVAARDFAKRADVIVTAMPWSGLEPALTLVGAAEGSLSGKTVIDCTNPIDFTTGRMLFETGSAAELVATIATGAHVVKALHLYAGTGWPFTGDRSLAPIVAVCGDDATALEQTTLLIGDLGARVAVLGRLDASRQAEEAAGFVMRLVAAGVNPRFAVPDVEPSR